MPWGLTICDHSVEITSVKEPQVERDVTASMTAAVFGLDGFEVLAATEVDGELEL